MEPTFDELTDKWRVDLEPDYEGEPPRSWYFETREEALRWLDARRRRLAAGALVPADQHPVQDD